MELNRTKIRLELERLGWSELKLAKRAKSHRQWLNRIMVGKAGISLKGVEKIADALGLDPKDLLK